MSLKIQIVENGLSLQEAQTLRFAACEIKAYITKVFADFDVCLSLGIGLSKELPEVEDPMLDDAIVIDTKESSGVITGTNARSVLIAAYRYLRELGFGFVRPGKDGEIYPETLTNKPIYIREKAAYRQRMVCLEGSASFECVLDMVDWLPKVAMNGYFTQFFTPLIFFKRWYHHGGYEFTNPCLPQEEITKEEVDRFKQKLMGEMEKRSLLHMDVGHAWTCEAFSMPAFGWEQVKDEEIPQDAQQYFALVDGKRQLNNKIPMNTQLCYGNPEVRRRLVDLVVEHCKKNKQMQYVSVWLADGSNVHCECDLCKNSRPADLYVRLLNEIDERLTAENINTKCSFCVYTDILWPPVEETLRNPGRFSLMFCPITRTYSQAMSSGAGKEIPDYVRNRLQFPTAVEDLLDHLAAWRKVFPGEVVVFDYYFQWDCYKDLGATETARVIHQDIRNYRDMDFKGLISCQGQRVFSPTALGMNVMARTLWDRDCDFEQVQEEVLRQEYGKDFGLARDFLQDLSIYSLPEVTRLEKPVSDPRNEEFYCKGIARVQAFLPVIEEHLKTATGVEQTSWRYLKFHTQLSCLVMQAFLNINRGAEPVDQWPVIEAFVNEKEWEMREYFDVFEFKYVYGRLFPKIKDMQKTLIIGI